MGKKTTSRSALNILGAIGEGDITSIARSRARGRAGLDNAYREGDFGLDSPAHQRPSICQSLQGVLIPDRVKTGAISRLQATSSGYKGFRP